MACVIAFDLLYPSHKVASLMSSLPNMSIPAKVNVNAA